MSAIDEAVRDYKRLVTEVPPASTNGNGHHAHAPEEEHDGAPPRRLHVATFAEVDATPLVPQKHLVRPHLPANESTMVFGPPKSFKSYLVLLWALSVALGRAVFGRYEVEQGRVLMIDLENRMDRQRERIHAVLASLGLPADALGDQFLLYHWPKDVLPWRMDGDGVRELADTVEHYRPAVVILDNFRKALPPGVDENANKDVNPILNAVLAACERAESALVLVHHTNKGYLSFSGAGCLESTVANTVNVTLDRDSGVAVVRAGVTRNAEDFEPFAVMMGANGVLQLTTMPESEPDTGAALLEALAHGGKTVAELAEATRLSDRQVRYHLKPLLASRHAIEIGTRSTGGRGAPPPMYGLPAQEVR